MKFLAVFLAAVVACAAPLVAADQCDTSLVTSIVGNGNVSDCASATGFDFTTLSTALTTEQVDTICSSESCVMLLEVLVALNVPDCTLSTGVNLRTDLIDPISAQCLPSASTSKSGSTSTDASASVSSSLTGSVTGSLTGSVSGSLSGSAVTAGSSSGTTDGTTNAGDVGSSQTGSGTSVPASSSNAVSSWTMTTLTGSVTTLLCLAVYLA